MLTWIRADSHLIPTSSDFEPRAMIDFISPDSDFKDASLASRRQFITGHRVSTQLARNVASQNTAGSRFPLQRCFNATIAPPTSGPMICIPTSSSNTFHSSKARIASGPSSPLSVSGSKRFRSRPTMAYRTCLSLMFAFWRRAL